MPDGKIRQHEALWWVEGVDKWASHSQKPLEVNLASKLLTLILNKYSLLDSENLGIMYEAERPGWNDALNGLPGIFGSGIGEMIELLRLARYFDKVINSYKINQIKVLKPLIELINNLLKDNKFAARIEAVELYRSKLHDLELESLEMKVVKEVIKMILNDLEKSLEKALNLKSIIPTYLTYEITKYQMLDKPANDYGQLIMPLEYQRSEVVPFLEAPARALKVISKDEAKKLYKKVKASDIYDSKLKMYKTSVIYQVILTI